MVSFFKSGQFQSLLVYLILSVGFPCIYYLKGDIGNQIDLGFWGTCPISSKLLACGLSSLFLLGNTLMVNFTFNRYEFYDKPNNFTGFVYIVIALCSPVFLHLNLLISDFLLLITVFLFLKINQNTDARKLVFNSSFFLGLGVSIYPSLLFISPIILFILFTIRPFVLREHILFLVGLLLPMLYSFATHYIIDHELYNWEKLIPHAARFNFNWSEGFLLLLFAFLSVYSYFIVQRKKRMSTVRFKKLAQIAVAFALFSFLSDIYTYLLYSHFFFNIAVSLSIFFSLGGLYSNNSRFFESIFIVVLFCMIWLNLVRIF